MSWQEWKEYDLERQFNPRTALGEKTDEVLASWNSKSMVARSQLTGTFDIAYGEHPLMGFDYHPGAAHKPIIINIHGGYWRGLDKSAMQHHMADLARSAFSIVNLNYPLCPEMSLTDILKALGQALEIIVDLIMQDIPNPRFVLCGHSAGAHLVAHLSHHHRLKDKLCGVVALTGIYETEVVRHIAVNDEIKMTPEEATRWCVIGNLPVSGPEYYIAVGAEEPSGWIDQSWQLAESLSNRGDCLKFRVVQSANHFDLVDRLCDPDTLDGFQLHQWIFNLTKS